nr:MAG TPA: hypothetical protein [Caudoviricetes sp.]
MLIFFLLSVEILTKTVRDPSQYILYDYKRMLSTYCVKNVYLFFCNTIYSKYL